MPVSSLISSFGISIAANIVSSLFARTDTEKEIRAAFQEAIDEWCPNEDVRKHKSDDLYCLTRKYIENPAMAPDALSEEESAFIDILVRKISARPAAFSYLSAITGREYYDIVMEGLRSANRKLDDISRKLDSVDPHHDELHAEAVIEINTVLHEAVESQIEILLYGILAAFDSEIYAYVESVDKDVKVVIDEGSKLMEEDGESFRPKYHDPNYDWEQEMSGRWDDMDPDYDFHILFSAAYIADFQSKALNFGNAVASIQECIDKNSINEQLSVAEKRHLSYIIQQLRAVQAVFEDHRDIFLRIENCTFDNLRIQCEKQFGNRGAEFGVFGIVYDDGQYSEEITQVAAPVRMASRLLDVYKINPEYYYKLTCYLGDLLSLVREWWDLSGGGFLMEDNVDEPE